MTGSAPTAAAARRVVTRRGASLGIRLRTALLGLWMVFSANADQPTEYQVKAACLYHFAIFVEWPWQAFAGSATPLVIGFFGDSALGDDLHNIIGRNPTAQSRRIEVRRYKSGDEPEGCHILFLPRSASGQIETILHRLDARPGLTVSETEDFVPQGGMIGFALVNRSVRFDVNTQSATAAQLRISSRLLELARTVLQSP